MIAQLGFNDDYNSNLFEYKKRTLTKMTRIYLGALRISKEI